MEHNAEKNLTLGVSSKGNTQALLLCLSSVLVGVTRPDYIQIRLEGKRPGFDSFYLEQLMGLAKVLNIPVRITSCLSTGVRDSRDWQLAECKTDYLWLVDDDVVVDCVCMAAYNKAIEGLDEEWAYLAGSKIDVNNRRNYPHFDMRERTVEELSAQSNHSHLYDIEGCMGQTAPTKVLDTGNVLFYLPPIKAQGCKFRQFPDQANPSGDATTFSLVLDRAGLSGRFVPSARAYHLEKENGGFNEFEARREMLLRTCEVKSFDKQIVQDYFMPVP